MPLKNAPNPVKLWKRFANNDTGLWPGFLSGRRSDACHVSVHPLMAGSRDLSAILLPVKQHVVAVRKRWCTIVVSNTASYDG